MPRRDRESVDRRGGSLAPSSTGLGRVRRGRCACLKNGDEDMTNRRPRQMLFAALAIAALAGAWPHAGEHGKARKPAKHRADALVARDPSSGPVGAATAAPLVTQTAAAVGAGVSSGVSSALVLYDSTGPYGWLGELYGVMAVNLAGHFGSWTA